MFVVVSYDVIANRCNKYHRLLSKYLLHKQNSLFVGEISDSKMNILKGLLDKLYIEGDNILIYKLGSSKYIEEFNSNDNCSFIVT